MPDSSWADPEGDRPHPWKIGFLSILVRFPLKSQSYQASIRCWAISGTPAKRHLNGVSLAGQWWLAYSEWCLDPLSHHQLKKKLSKLDPFLDPRMQLSNYVLCAKSAFMRQCTKCYTQLLKQHVAWKRRIWSSCLRLILLADRFDPDQARQNVFNVCIHNKGADKNVRYPGWSATLLVSYNKVGVKQLQTCGKDVCKFWYECHRGWSQGLLLFH